jgi:YD repeat-containing protein
MKKTLLILDLFCIIFLGLLIEGMPVVADDLTYKSCQSVRTMMIMPEPPLPYLSDEYNAKGIVFTSDRNGETFAFTANDRDDSPNYAYVFLLNITATGNLNLQFSNLRGDIEYALFRGAQAFPNTGIAADSAFAYVPNKQISIDEPDFYTLVVRRAFLDVLADASFRLNATFPTVADFNRSSDWVGRVNKEIPVDFEEAWNIVTLKPANQELRVNADSLFEIIETPTIPPIFFRKDSRTKGDGRMFFGGWANEISLVGGSLAVLGDSRRLFISDFVPFDEQFTNVQGAQAGVGGDALAGDLTRLESFYGHLDTDWLDISGIWIVDHCLGVLFTDGHTFIASLPDDTPYNISLRNGLSNFQAILEIPDENEIKTFSLNLNWDIIAPEHEVNIHEVALRTLLKTGESIELQALHIEMGIDHIADGFDLTQIKLLDENVSILLDGETINSFLYDRDDLAIELGFEDLRSASTRPNPSRSARDLRVFELFDSVIRLKYDDGAGNRAERLWLPEQDGFIELYTPPVPLNYNPMALPNEENYIPTGLNNLGNECYTSSTLLPATMCVRDVLLNYANSNLWYPVTDLAAYGGLLDLMLIRSYNSYDFLRGGAFGPGWTSELLLDYQVQYDAGQAARIIDTRAMRDYRVGLDLLYAPHGYVMYQTPSGSRHLFQRSDNNASDDLDTFTTRTMPDWVLYRRGTTEMERVRAPWILRQENGFVLKYDRSGRLVWYGYPIGDDWESNNEQIPTGQIVQIIYDRSTLTGPKNQIAIITDDATNRQLELYYDDEHRIDYAILRDMTVSPTEECLLQNNCHKTDYGYDDNGYLTDVIYDNGSLASYTYNDRRLTNIEDARAPISQNLRVNYSGDNNNPRVGQIHIIGNNDEPILWLNIGSNINGQLQKVTVVNGNGVGSDYTYCYDKCEANEFYTLIEQTSLLAETLNFGSSPAKYNWENGRLLSINFGSRGDIANLLEPTQVAPDYNLTGSFAPLRIDMLAFSRAGFPTTYQPSQIDMGDGTILNVLYDEAQAHTWPMQVSDNSGAIYRFERSLDSHYRVTRLTLYNSMMPETAVISWTYEYNPIGLVTKVTRFAGNGDNDDGYPTAYQWNGLGQLTGISEGTDTPISIRYIVRQTGPALNEIHLVDALSTTAYCYDSRGRLIDEVLIEGNIPSAFLACDPLSSSFLRRTTYEYDIQDRLIEKTEWLKTQEIDIPDKLSTRYSYRPQLSMTNMDSSGQIDINGYQITVIDPYDRQTVYLYDALNRLREVRDVFSHTIRYFYDYHDFGTDYNSGSGPRILQQDIWDKELIATTEYLFDSKHQIQAIMRYPQNNASSPERLVWEFATKGDNSIIRITAMNMGTYPLGDVVWSYNANQQTTFIPQTSVGDNVDPEMMLTLDFLQRPITYQFKRDDGEMLYQQISYCPLVNGQRAELYRTRSRVGDFNCASEQFDKRILYDGQDRVIQIQDADGIRDYNYAVEGKHTLVRVTDSNAETSQQSLFRYNAAGDLTAWQDASGITYAYEVDTLGRLISSRVVKADSSELTAQDQQADCPNGDICYLYNEANQVEREINNQTNTAFTYFYNQQSLLTSIRDKTGDVTTFAYDRIGRLTTVITPLGRTITYRYADDFLDMTRPVEVVRGGVSYQLEWQDRPNCLLITDPQDYTMAYIYDMVGLLQRVRDNCDDNASLANLNYDSNGYLTAWQVGDAPERFFDIHSSVETGITFEAGQDSEWSWNVQYDEQGHLTLISNNNEVNIGFVYDVFGRLTRIAPLDEQGKLDTDEIAWSISYQGAGETALPQVTYSNTYTNANIEAISKSFIISYDDMYNWVNSEDIGISYKPLLYSKDLLYGFTQDDVVYLYQFVAADLTDVSQQSVIYLHAPGQTRQYVYDTEGRLLTIQTRICTGEVQATNQLNINPCNSWNPDSEIQKTEEDPGTIWETETSIEYNAQGLPFRISENGLIETFAYDARGNITLYQDTSGRTFRYLYDDYSRLIRLESPANLVLVLEYGVGENPIVICLTNSMDAAADINKNGTCADDPGWLESYEYDELGRPISRSYPVTIADMTQVHRVQYEYKKSGFDLVPWLGDNILRDAIISFDDGTLLGRLKNIDDSETINYEFVYQGLNHLSNVNRNRGATRISQLQIGEGVQLELEVQDNPAVVIDYLEMNNSLLLRSADKEQIINLNTAGFVDDLNLVGIPDTQAIDTDYYKDSPIGSDDYFVNVLGSLDGSNTTLLYENAYGQISSVVFDSLIPYTLNYSLTPAGQIQRQSLIFIFTGAASQYLHQSVEKGYTIQMGYDEAGRPLTMQINDSETGQPLYLLSLTHDDFGRILKETRQYLLEDQNTLVDISYEYAEDNLSQLVESHVEIKSLSGEIEQDALYIFVPVLLIGFLFSYRRRSPIILLMMIISSLGLVTIIASAQEGQERDTFDFVYNYDAHGNLTEVRWKISEAERPLCAEYRFDSANRLLEANLPTQAKHSVYRYTASHQLEQLNDDYLLYYDDQRTPAFAYNAAESSLTFLSNLLPDLPLYQYDMKTDEVLALYSNGLGEVLAYGKDDRPIANDTFWIFDPLGRLITIEWPQNISEGCDLFSLNSAEFEEVILSFNNMIWDSRINLMFDGARAYNPILGRYLQRDSQGPDALGNSYSYYPALPEPPIARKNNSIYERGLQVLDEIQQDLNITQTLSSDTIWQKYSPVPIGYQADEFYQSFHASQAHVQTVLGNTLALSEQLMNHYRPRSVLEAQGMIRFYVPFANANPLEASRRSFVHTSPISGVWLPTTPLSTPARIERASSLLGYSDYRLRLTDSQQWRPQTLNLDNLWLNPEPNLSYSPQTWTWLLSPLRQPDMALQTLNAVDMITTMPDHNAVWWIDRSLESALPAIPDLPPNSLAEWREQWFDTDVLGTQAVMDAAWPLLEYPSIPAYHFGNNLNGPDTDIDERLR